MDIPDFSPDEELSTLAVETQGGCRRFLGTSAESVVGLLTVAALQLEAAHVGARMAAKPNRGAHPETLRASTTDSGEVGAAALNLSVRCSVRAVDLCAAALGRLTGDHRGWDRRFDAATARRAYRHAAPDSPLRPLIEAYLARVTSVTWWRTEKLRDQVTHKMHKHRVHGSTQWPPQPGPLATPQHTDVGRGDLGLSPEERLSHDHVKFAEDTFREFCKILTALESPV